MVETGATFSECRTWRYRLWRVWEPDAPAFVTIGLNPSTADETQDDPTIRRCINFAKREECGRLVMLNIFAVRTPDPKVMKIAGDPVGPENDAHLIDACQDAKLVVAAWGTHGAFRNRDLLVKNLFRAADIQLHCFGRTKEGYPKHPLYLRRDVQIAPYWPAGGGGD